MRAARARRLSAATARAAARARGSIAFAPAKSNALIMSTMSNAACRSRGLAPDRGIPGSGQCRFTAYRRLPAELEPGWLAFRRELQPLGAGGQHVRLAFD